MGEAEAREVCHGFATVVCFFPIVGAILSDAVLGKYRTILFGSVVYCFGHLALDETRLGLAGARYYGFFAALMFVTALVFVVVAKRYREQTYIQDSAPAAFASSSRRNRPGPRR